MPSIIYLLKLKQDHGGIKTELDFAFKSSAQVYFYLQDLWDNWQQNLSQEDWERVPPLPTIGELKAGLSANISHLTGFETYEIMGLGYLNGDETFSVVLTLTRMPVY